MTKFIMEEVQLLSKDLEERGQDFSYDVCFTRDGDSYDQCELVIGPDNTVGMQVRKLRSGEDPVPAALVYIFLQHGNFDLRYPNGTKLTDGNFFEDDPIMNIFSRLGDVLYAAVSQDERYALSAAFPVDSLEP